MDLINRQDAIGKIQTWLKHSGYSEGERNVMGCAIQMLESLPSAEQEQKTGKWIEHEDWYDTYYECSSCGEAFSLIEGTPKDNGYNYCPNCGSEMVGEEE